MRATHVLALVCLATLMAGCGDEKSASGDSSEGSGKPPENMCEAVAPAVPEDWKLTKKAAPQKNKAKTDCTLTDESGYETVLVVGLTKPKPGKSVEDIYKKLCDFYISRPQERDDSQCTQTGPIKLKGSPTEIQRGVLVDDPPGVLWLTFQTNKPDIAAEVEDVLKDVESAASGS